MARRIMQENTPKCMHADAHKLHCLVTKLEIPSFITTESFKLYNKVIQLGYPKSFIVFLGCFAIQQKLYLDETIKLLDISKYFGVSIESLRETERRILIKIRYDCRN